MKREHSMRSKILCLCLGITLMALVLQTILFESTSTKLIYNKAKEDSFSSLQNMQNDVCEFVKSIESSLIKVYNEKVCSKVCGGRRRQIYSGKKIIAWRTAWGQRILRQTMEWLLFISIHQTTRSSVHTGGRLRQSTIIPRIFMPARGSRIMLRL